MLLSSFSEGSTLLLTQLFYGPQLMVLLQMAMTCCSNIQCGPMKYRGNSVWFKTLSLYQSKLGCYKRVLFKAVTAEMFATKNRSRLHPSNQHEFFALVYSIVDVVTDFDRLTSLAFMLEQPAATHRLPISINIILTSLPGLLFAYIYHQSHIQLVTYNHKPEETVIV